MTRLTRSDWINFGLKTLAKAGFTALKADVLAKGLKVSRGSFYWHFADVLTFHDAVIAQWMARSSDVAGQIDASAPPRDQLRVLMQAASFSDHGLERAVRAWGQSSDRVRGQVDQLDAFRLSAITDILTAALHDPQEAQRRAKLLYAAAIGLSQADPGQLALDTEDIDALAQLFAP